MNGGGRHFYKQIHTTGIVFHHRPFLKSQQQQQTVNMVCCIWYICYFVCYKRFLHARKPQSCHIGGLIIYFECQINLIILMFHFLLRAKLTTYITIHILLWQYCNVVVTIFVIILHILYLLIKPQTERKWKTYIMHTVYAWISYTVCVQKVSRA